ncbi:RhoGAP domain-containing protein [Cavenderia fasciculata]|uniref:RhoGAP domain-containing protein n=1 Tax=Cavenderia fasciculata TaxID=261658 RepID=F4PZW8_CACFS|nr:RhoGAP domain-containing protein [Cavenderia fasciculata]EGG18882.1 RhoGAP domain-containing protein [Cavenderia fasciculata]|eukprot:XP_004357344.1 RhoGAP domain-containing protein [Cavenderia fasciculata]
MQKRYSRPASITISGLLPTDRLASGAAVSSSPSSNGGTITSTTITSPNDASTPITFTVTTTYLDEQQSNSATGTPPPSIQVTQPGGSFNNNMLEQPSSANSTMVDRSYQSNRRAHKLEDIQYQQFIEEHQFLKNQFQQQGGAANNNSNNTASSSSFDNIGRSYRRSTMFVAPSSSSNTQQQQQQTPPSNGGIVVPPTAPTGVDEYASLQSSSGSFINNNITKANIQQLKEKIDRYSKEKMRELRESQSSIRTSTSNLVPQGYERVGNSSAASAGDPVPNKDKLYRYSIDVERFKDNRRNSRDIGREIEREINKRLSPRERISMLLANQQEYTTTNSPGGGAVGSAPVNGSNNRNYRYSNQPFGGSNKYVTRDSGSDRSNRNSNRFSRDSYKDYNYNDEEEMYNREEMYNIQRQRSQSCFEQQQDPINVVSGSSNGIGSGIGGIGSTLNNNINNVNTNRQSGSYQSVLLEQKMDKIRETINNIKIDRDRDNTRNSRDYTNHMRDIDELRQSLQKESETSEFFAIKSLELVEKLRKEEEKNLKLMEELSLMESYFHLKEKLKRSKRQSTTKQLLTRSRSPTLPTNMNHPSTSPSFFNIPSPTTTTTTSTSSTSTMNQ